MINTTVSQGNSSVSQESSSSEQETEMQTLSFQPSTSQAQESHFGVNQYVSWCFPMEDLCLDTIWSKCNNFASLKQMKSEPDLTCFQASDKEIDL